MNRQKYPHIFIALRYIIQLTRYIFWYLPFFSIALIIAIGKQHIFPSGHTQSGIQNSDIFNAASDMKYIGDMYYSGSGIQSNKKIAANWYQKASNAGDAESQFTLGKMLMSGDGINRDLQAGLDLIQKAAEQGHAAAQNLFGIHLLDGEGIDKNQTEAYAWFIKAAQQNNPEALNHAAQMFFIGYGNLDTALQMLNQAAEHGVSDAQLRLGLMYEHGEYVKKSIAMAIYWFRRAADRHNAIALQHLAALSINHKHHMLQSE